MEEVDKTFDILAYGKCDCGNPGTELHTCPYAEEMNNSHGECNCCNKCCQECANDI